MEGSIVFYTYGSTLELYGQQFTAGMLTADLLNLSPDEYRPMSKRMKQVTSLAEEYEQSGSIELWWKLNEELAALCRVLRRYAVFRLLLDESEDAFFSVIREVTGQFDLFPKEEHEPSEEIQRKRLERVANEISARSETVKDVPLDLFHPSEAALEKGDAFYYEMLRAIGPTKDAWRDYKKYIRRYETYLHDIRAFNGTIRNFISFSLSKLKHNSPEDYAAALYGFYNDERIAEKLIVNPIRNNGDCYTTHDAYELSYVPRTLVLADAGYDLRLLRRTGAGAGRQDLPGDRSHQQLSQQGAEQRCLEGSSAGLQKIFCPYPKGDDEQGRV